MNAMGNNCWFMIYSVAETLSELKRSELDEPTAKELHELINQEEKEAVVDAHNKEEEEAVVDAHNQEEEEAVVDAHNQEEEEAVVDEVVQNHEVVENGVHQNIIAFGANEEFIRKLNCGEIRVESLILPDIGRGIDECILPQVPPIESLQGKIGICSTPFEKQLTITDLEKHQGRVSFGKLPVEGQLLPMMKIGEDIVNGINVTVYNEIGKGFPMCFAFWSNKLYILKSGWKKFALDNELMSCEDWVTVWMFRHNDTDELCFAIIPRRFPITVLLKAQKKRGKKAKAN